MKNTNSLPPGSVLLLVFLPAISNDRSARFSIFFVADASKKEVKRGPYYIDASKMESWIFEISDTEGTRKIRGALRELQEEGGGISRKFRIGEDGTFILPGFLIREIFGFDAEKLRKTMGTILKAAFGEGGDREIIIKEVIPVAES